MSPQQEIFTAIRGICVNLFGTSNVFDYLPPEGTPYPFVFLGEDLSSDDRANKTAVFGTYNLTLHIYHNDYRKRGTTTNMMLLLKEAIRALDQTMNFDLEVVNIRDQVLPDNTTATPLLHGIVEVEIQFN